ncbi:MAG: hypothetical protein V4494_01265 [Chlamydiota bacterium]
MNKYFLLFVVGYMFVTHADLTRSMDERINMNKLANQISSDFSKKMEKKFGFKLYGLGGGGDCDLNTFSLHFQCPMILDLCEARNLIIEITQNFLDIVNSDKNIKPYLRVYPFTVNNLDFIIGFTIKNTYPIEGKIAFIGFNNGKINYATYDHEKKILKTIFRETYDEALNAVEQEKNTIPLKNTDPLNDR